MKWLTNHPELSESLSERLGQRIKSGKFKHEDIAYVSRLSLFPISDASSISPSSLENLRRLSETFEIKFEPRIVSSHRKIIGPLIVLSKKILFRVLGSVLKESFAKQTKFNAEVVSFVAQLAANQNGNTTRDSKL